MSGFAGLRVLALESRRATELAKLVGTYGGEPVVAPAMREVPLESNKEALAFATIIAPEPNTWRELLLAIDEAGASREEVRLRGARVAVQEYGVSNLELLSSLGERGAAVTRVPVYQWALPEDCAPLQAAVKSLVAGEIDVVLFTTSVQVTHLFQIAAEMNLEEPMRLGLGRAIVASIGPTTSEELQRHGVRADLEPSHPKMGFLAKETAEQSGELLRRKRQGIASAG